MTDVSEPTPEPAGEPAEAPEHPTVEGHEAPVMIHDLQAESLGDEDAGPETPDEHEETIPEAVMAPAPDEPTAEGEGVTA